MLNLRRGLHSLVHPPSQNVASLDVLRSLAIALVFCGHYAAVFSTSTKFQRLPPVYFGWTGVDLFFVLSGYLIGAQIWKELQRTGNIKIGNFLLRRGFRIWPLYFSFVLLIAMEGLLTQRDVSGLWADAALVSDYFHHEVGGGWSLSTEEQFYILFPVVILFLAPLLPKRRLVWVPIVSLVLLPYFRAMTFLHYAGMPTSQVRDIIYRGFHTHADGLAMGVLIAWVKVFWPRVLSSSRRVGIFAVAGIATGGILYVLNRDIFSYSSLAFIFGSLLIIAIAVQAQWPAYIAVPFYVTSRLSYGIYLIHFGLLEHLMKLFGNGQSRTLFITAGYCLFSFAITAAVAVITFLLIEHPFLEMRERFQKRQKPAPLASAPNVIASV